jgi:hypothetical protein
MGHVVEDVRIIPIPVQPELVEGSAWCDPSTSLYGFTSVRLNPP